MVVPLVIASSGDAAWITFLVATAAVILISVNINLLARSSASPGSLYGLVREHFGRWPSIIAGWSLLIAYIGCDRRHDEQLSRSAQRITTAIRCIHHQHHLHLHTGGMLARLPRRTTLSSAHAVA
jgi:hypothetical protein